MYEKRSIHKAMIKGMVIYVDLEWNNKGKEKIKKPGLTGLFYHYFCTLAACGPRWPSSMSKETA
jgi:hypothetical protein